MDTESTEASAAPATATAEPEPVAAGPQQATDEPQQAAPAPQPTSAPQPTPAPRAPRDHTVALAILKMLERSLVWLVQELIKPKARVVVVGIALIVFGAFLINHSVWTFPLVIIGAIMIIVAWVGTRLEGRFGIEWSDGGAGFEMRARFRPALELQVRAPHLPAAPAPFPATTMPSTSTSTDTQPREDPAVDAEVIEGEAHTIEIDVEELRALVAAAERATTSTATTNGTSVSWREVPARRPRGDAS